MFTSPMDNAQLYSVAKDISMVWQDMSKLRLPSVFNARLWHSYTFLWIVTDRSYRLTATIIDFTISNRQMTKTLHDSSFKYSKSPGFFQ